MSYIISKTRIYINMMRKIGFFPVVIDIITKIKFKVISFVSQVNLIIDEKRNEKKFYSLVGERDRYDNSTKIPLVVQNFFDLNGNNMFFGGAERYIIELQRLISEMGYELIVYQCANSNWVRYYGDVKVIGINTGGNNITLLNRYFHAWVSRPKLTIYFQMTLATPFFNSPSICVSHGVDWDSPWLQFNKKAFSKFIKSVISSINNTNVLVSVDTNTINWIRASDYQLSEKCIYVPNFVNCVEFKPIKRENDRLIILFPRRLSEARGLKLMLQVIPSLLMQYPNLEFHFCGKANQTEEIEVAGLINQFPENIKRFFYPPNKMYKVYDSADIVIIPTLYSEGTSLSCLEAMASGKAVVATNVGGLPNLIIPNYNGLLIEPDVNSLKNAIELLINDSSLREKIGNNGIETAKSFDLEYWRQRWLVILKKFIILNDDLSKHLSTTVILFLDINWLSNKKQHNYIQKIAIFLAQQGFDIFWIDSETSSESGFPNLHLLTKGKHDLYFQNPVIFINKPFNSLEYSFTPKMVVDLTIERGLDEYLEIIKSTSNIGSN